MGKKVLKWIGIVLGGLVGLAVLAFGILFIRGNSQANKHYNNIPAEAVTIPIDASASQYGAHLATILICTRCHGQDLAGQVEYAIPGLLTIPTPNLTAGNGGVGSFYTDEDWVRAIRHGVGHDNRPLFIMPSQAFYHLSNEDLGALIAYLKSVPAVDNELPPREIALAGKLMMGAGMFPDYAVDLINHDGPRPTVPPASVTAAYGQYLAHTCTECHGADLNGMPFGPPGKEVPSPNLTPAGPLASWTVDDFFTTIRTGTAPDGRHLSEDMPWPYFSQMTDDELTAVWLYLQSLPPLPQGG